MEAIQLVLENIIFPLLVGVILIFIEDFFKNK